MSVRLHGVHCVSPELVALGGLAVHTHGEGFVEITNHVRRFVEDVKAEDGAVFLYIRHTSASLVIQENADPDVQADLTTALRQLAPAEAGWMHEIEGPDDMPAHVRTMLTGVSLHVPVIGGSLGVGTWQGIYVAEHRSRPHQREVTLTYVGSRRNGK